MTDPFAVLMSSFDLPSDERALQGVHIVVDKPGNYEFRSVLAEPIRQKLEPGHYFVRVLIENNDKPKITCVKLPWSNEKE